MNDKQIKDKLERFLITKNLEFSKILNAYNTTVDDVQGDSNKMSRLNYDLGLIDGIKQTLEWMEQVK